MSQLRQWLASLTCNLCVAFTGTNFVWMAPLMVVLTSNGSPISMTKTDSSWLSSFIEISAVIFTIPSGLLADRFGRKTLLLTTGPISLAAWIIIVLTRSIEVLYLVRFLQGIAVATAYTIGPVYIAETAAPDIRGKLSGQFQTMFFAGILYAYIAGAYLSYNWYAIVCAILPIVTTIMLIFMPESPYYYLMVKEEEKAKEALQWLRGEEDISTEFYKMKLSVDEDMVRKGGWKDLFATKKNIKGFLIVQLVCLVKYLGGMCAVVMYITQTFEEEFPGTLQSHEMSIALVSLLVVTTLVSSLLTDKVGRKPLLVLSVAGAAFFNLVIAIIYYLDSNTPVNVDSIKWITYVSLICFSVISNIGLGPLMQTIQAEYFPSHTRGVGGGITGMIASAGSFVNIKQYQFINDTFGLYMNYVIFFLVSLFGMILFSFVITETSGQSLAEIQDTFQEKVKKKKSNGELISVHL